MAAGSAATGADEKALAQGWRRVVDREAVDRGVAYALMVVALVATVRSRLSTSRCDCVGCSGGAISGSPPGLHRL
ncbi:unnamed protein product [Triticum turgidum subsp. durum]|uniref:Uncharacterized protein n=1 Tax=Triticum turgidum subsp. durum TaxID=4567 RepID=A0A9R1AZ02_TRITD|nr:unnamed protein product [Triticum turgidum subsp. durum]